MYPSAVPPVTVCLIFSPITGVPVGETIFIALTDEKSFAVYIDVDPIDVGFFIILICANLVSVGKSLVESSNLA